MLHSVLKAFADFEAKHHESANILDISHKHFRMLVAQYPGIFDSKSQLELGFCICLHDDRDQIQPAVRKIALKHDVSSGRGVTTLLEAC